MPVRVLSHLRVRGGLQHLLGQLIEQAVQALQLDTLLLGMRQQLLSQPLLVHLVRHGLRSFMVDRSHQAQLGVSNHRPRPTEIGQSRSRRTLDERGLRSRINKSGWPK